MKPGLYLDMSAREYFADPCPQPSLTQSIAKILIDKSPAHARLAHPRLNPDFQEPFEYEKRLAIGNAAHKLLIGRGKEVCIIEADDFRKADARETRDRAITDGYVPILAKHMKQAHELVKAARAQLDAIGLIEAFKHGDGEVVIAWEENGIWFRSMIDWVEHISCTYTDLKTSGLSASPLAVPHVMASAGWPIQAAMQERGLDVVDPDNAGRRTFIFIMVENTPPYALTAHEMSEAVMTIGRKQLEYAVRVWRQCIETGKWPAYPPIVNVPEYPGYKEQQWLAREIAEEDARTGDRLQSRETMLTDLMGG
jgi:hypothetical protein